MTITFTKVGLPYGWLGNMAPYPILFDGKEWRTTEALFQALRFNDPTCRERIREERSPMSAKLVAKSLADRMEVSPLSVDDLNNMRMVLRLKVEQHPELKEMLLETGTEEIIEDVTSRKRPGNHDFWGARLVDGTWKGQNVLGKMWMDLRDELRPGT